MQSKPHREMIKFRTEGPHSLSKGSKFSAGYDVPCAEDITLNGRTLVRTGIYIEECPEDVYLRVAPRSKLALKFGIEVLAGVVDSDYRGEICVILDSKDGYCCFKAGDKIAQLIPERLYVGEVIVDDKGNQDVRGGELAGAPEDSTRGNSGIRDDDLRL